MMRVNGRGSNTPPNFIIADVNKPAMKEHREVFIAMPSLDGKMTTGCGMSLLRNTNILRDMGYKVIPYFHNYDFIDRARNICVELFLSTTCSDIVFFDSDEEFEGDAMAKVLKYDRPIVAAAIPKKKDTLEFQTGVVFDHNENCKEESTGLVTVGHVGSGFMRIQRTVFEKMISHYKMRKNGDGIYQFFKTGESLTVDEFIDKLTEPRFENKPVNEIIERLRSEGLQWNDWYGEDYYFCKRWREMGGEIFIEPNLTFSHTGYKNYKGNYHDFLMGRRVINVPQKSMVVS